MSKYTEDFPNLSTYDFDTIMCQLRQVCGADPSGLINAQFLSRPTTAKDIALLLHITYELFQSQIELQKQFVELYTFVKDFFENLDLQEEVNIKLEEMAETGELATLIASAGMVLKYYNTFADLKSDTALQSNQIVMTRGFYNAGDKGSCIYLIGNKGLEIDNGLKAKPITNIYYLPCYGATYTDDGTATYNAIQTMLSLNLKCIQFPDDSIKCKVGIKIPYNIEIIGSSTPLQSECRMTGGDGIMFEVGDDSNAISVLVRDITFWDNDATTNPIPSNNTPCDSEKTVFYLHSGVYSKFENVKFNRCNYCILGNPDFYNYTLDFIGCRFDSNNYCIDLGKSCQAVNIMRCDFNNDLTAISLDSGLGSQIIAFNQIEGCRIGISKTDEGDLHVVYNYFDNNKFRDLIVFKTDEGEIDLIDFSYNYVLANTEPLIVDCNFPSVMLNIFENKIEANNAPKKVYLYLNNVSDNITLFSNHLEGNVEITNNTTKLQELVRSGNIGFTADCIYSASTNYTPTVNVRRVRLSDNNITVNLPSDDTFPVNTVLTFYIPLTSGHTVNFTGNVTGKTTFSESGIATAVKYDSSDWYIY